MAFPSSFSLPSSLQPVAGAAAGQLQVPAPVGAMLSRLPAYPGSLLLVAALNLALARHLPADVGALLLHKKMRVHVRDARLTFDFAWAGQRFAPAAPLPQSAAADLTLSASAHDFLLLAQRQQDPDTLFFSRRLSMEGDTELGLVVKNALDAIELPVLDPRQWAQRLAPQQVLASLRRHLAPQQRG